MSRNQRLNSTITIGSVLDNSVRRNIGFLKSGLESVGNEIKGVERKQRELGSQRRVLVRQGQSVEALDREYEQLSRTLVSLRRAQERWNRAAAASRRVGSTFSTMMGDITRNSRALAIGVGLAGGAIFGLAASTATLGDGVAKTADKLGIGTAQLQELRYAAERSGVSTSDFDKALEKLNKNLGEAIGGTGTAKDALDQLGLSAADLAAMSPEDALGLIADRMEGVETAAERAAIANDIFGRSGIGMINMLRGGSDGLAQLRDDARRTGYVLSEQATRDAEVFQDTLLDTQLTMLGLKNTVGAALLPVVTRAMRSIGDLLIDNREDVERWAQAFADGTERAIPVIGEVATGLLEVVRVTGSVIANTADMVGGWENFGIVVGAAIASRTLLRIGKFVGAVFSLGRAMLAVVGAGPLLIGVIKAIGLAMIANPIGAIVTAIAIGATLIVTNWKTIKPVLQPIIDWVGSAVSSLWEKAQPVLDGIAAGARAIGSAWQEAKDSIAPVLDWLGERFAWLGRVIEPVIDALRWARDKGGAVVGALGIGVNAPPSAGSAGRTQSTPSGASGVVPTPSGGSSARLTTKAMGGSYNPGWLLTGEKGPELRYENRGGYIADNRAMRQLAAYADRAASGSAPAATGRGVVQHITNHINATGMSANELFDIAERRSREQAGGALFDGAGFGG